MAGPNLLPDAETETGTEGRVERQPPYAVVLHNDDWNGMDFVVAVLRKVFGYPVEKCLDLMQEAHDEGRSVVWVGTLEVAELKAEQIHSCGPDPRAKKAQPLQATVEPTA